MPALFTGNRPHFSWLMLAAAFGTVLAVSAQDIQPLRDESSAPHRADSNRAKRHREGMTLQKLEGVIQQVGENYVLAIVGSDGRQTGEQFRLLENLALERAANLLQQSESPEARLWVVSGTVTEFKQNNYLLMTRIVAKEQMP